MRALWAAVLMVGLASLARAEGPREYKQGLVAHYYQDPQFWGGNWPDGVSVPKVNPADWTFTTYAYSRVEPLINHLFIRNGWFSIRWVGYINIEPGASGEHKASDPVNVGFELWADDGARLFIDGQKLIDDWRARWEKTPQSRRKAAATLTPGYHRIVIEYFQGQSLEKDDHDPAKLYWTIGGRRQIVPASHLFHTDEDLETR
ncbi:MAG TPA: PA14 domain-containing protein [Planctomycetota bacterium]|nr:PA14 domain-containing protein [Planctomycetota bacterium]HRR82061.1 PA14 domain-containing protein [Planctomycetota bacterium]HRT94516.1 PA14 domain-containing protein [Planctomycetota bacterium]